WAHVTCTAKWHQNLAKHVGGAVMTIHCSRFKGALALAAVLAFGGRVAAQVPGTPVLQNAFLNPGLAVAANFASASGQSFFGAAASLGLGGGKLQVSGG